MSDAASEPQLPDARTPIAVFVDKWRARWPEWGVTEVFVSSDQRELVLAWAALQQELTDAAWGGADPRPGESKLAWWQEELAGWSRGAHRHPLGAMLQRQPAPWDALAMALPLLGASRERPTNADAAYDAVTPVARAIAQIDTAILGARPAQSDADAATDTDAVVVAATLLHARLAHASSSAVPLTMLARAGEGEANQIWAAQLRARWPQQRATTRPRRLWATLAKARLKQSDVTQPLPAWKTLPIAWRAARG